MAIWPSSTQTSPWCSPPHLEEPGTMLILLGDYIHEGPDSYGVLDRIMELQRKWGTDQIAGDPLFHDIYHDGQSHYYIDGSILSGGAIPVLKVDTEAAKYHQVTESGDWPVLPYDMVHAKIE